ncbi:MAG TPA: methyltransferase domain-containing protein, partial [Spirillospora sp.]|nr:methyltransferase domain-containing protein [Spirillospora sp.]
MSLRFYEIAEANHRILNPFTEDQLLLLGDICRLDASKHQLDLCCGKAEMLCRWAQRYGIRGTGVDISAVFLAAARQRVAELNVEAQVTLIEADASKYPIPAGTYDIISCIGATWIGNGLVGTLELMKPGLKDRDSLILVGEPFWLEEPPAEAVREVAGGDPMLFTSLAG